MIVAVGGGSIAGYPVFLWAKSNGILSIRDYHYPAVPALVVVVVLIVVQMMLTLALTKSLKNSL